MIQVVNRISIFTQSSKEGLNYKLAKKIKDSLKERPIFTETEIYNFSDFYSGDHKLDSKFIKKVIENTDQMIWIVPEWNLSFPASVKNFIDCSGWPSDLKDMEILLIGTSNTKTGNLNSLTHLTSVLNFIGSKPHRKTHSISKLNKKKIKVSNRLDEIITDFLGLRFDISFTPYYTLPEGFSGLFDDKNSDCLHDNCPKCNGSGNDKFGGVCIHFISCPCPKCSPSFITTPPFTTYSMTATVTD